MMKKLFFLFLIFIFPLFSFAEEKIKNFDVNIGVNQDATINVIENIKYDYDNLQDGLERHGLYRDIPYKYQADYGAFNFDFSDVSVSTDNFEYYSYDKYLRIDTNPNPNIHVSGVKDYAFKYTVNGAIGYFSDFDEIYWNTTGNEWGVAINSATAKIVLPKPLPENELKISCYEGVTGNSENCKYLSVINNGLVESVVFSSARGLNPKEGMTIAISFPKGIIYEPMLYEKIIKALWENKILMLPFFIFFIMFYLWYTKGRDPKGTGVIIPQYEVPEGLTPMEVGVIINQSVGSTDISAEIIYLATKGYIKINKTETQGFIFNGTDYVFEKLKKDEISETESIDNKLINSLFNDRMEIKLSELTNKFYKKAEVISNMVLNKSVADGYYNKNPKETWRNYFLISLLLFFIFSYIPASLESGSLFVSLIISFTIIFLFSFIMPKKTEKGMVAYEYILGLKDYLQIAEKDRINFHNAPEKKPEVFERFLPYAMVLGVEKAWANEFQDIYMTPPNWYHDASGGNFSAVIFANNMRSFSSSASSTLTSAPGGQSGSGGGGSSGGGGGGGGGGSH